MRFLYGDSAPFPPQYDFLAALEVFCTQAARIVRLDAEARALRRSTEEAARQRGQAVQQLEAFHRHAVVALRDSAGDSEEPLVREYVRQVGELAQHTLEDHRRLAIQTSDREQQKAVGECDRRRAEVRDALEKLLSAVQLPVAETSVKMGMVDGRNEFSAVFAYDGGIVASFTLASDDVEEWRQPRHVRDFAQDISLPVGVRRSLFKRTVASETIALDEYIVGGFDLRDDRAELRLRRRAEHPDSIVLVARRIEDRLDAEVHHPDDAEAEAGIPPGLDASTAAEVERLWQVLHHACVPVLARKKRLVKLALAADDVFEFDLGARVVAQVVQTIAPIVAEVSRRSPNVHELSLKVENDSGRREEVYLRKAQLVSALSNVPPKERSVFDPLGFIASGPRDSIESLPDDAIFTTE